MKEFYISGGIRLMERSDIDDFMRLLKNLRGGITQIVKRHAKIDLDNLDNLQSSIYYLDANNLYGGAMHRMMPYELESIQNEEKLLDNVNRNPNKWVQSLKTFSKHGYFVECDIEAPVELTSKHQWNCTTSSMTFHSSRYRRQVCNSMVSRSTQRRMTLWRK